MNSSAEPAACRLSIIVPTRNRPDLLARALDAIAVQSCADYEVLVIDDGSSAAARARYPALFARLGARFRLHQLGGAGDPGLGPSVTRNHGIALARGAVLAFCDDDDCWTDAAHLAMLDAAFAARPELDAYIANQCAVAPGGAVSRPVWLPALDAQLHGPRPADGLWPVRAEQLCRAGGFAQLNIFALRADLARRIGGFWVKVSYEEDRDFYWRAIDCARAVVYNPRVIGRHNEPDRARQDNQSTGFTGVERWVLSALVSQHVAMTVRTPAIAALCRSYEGDVLRRVAVHFASGGRPELGLQYARRAFAARGSLKWLAYMAMLYVRSVLPHRTAP